MGYIKHNVVVIVGYKEELINRVDSFKKRLPEELSGIVIGPFIGVNGYTTYCWAADGSKEGWDASLLADEWRANFAALGADAVEARFGGDDSSLRVYSNGVELSGSQEE